MAQTYSNWEEAATAGRNGKAVGKATWQDRNGRQIPVEVMIGRGMEPTIFYQGSGYVVDKAPARLVDSIRRWKPY